MVPKAVLYYYPESVWCTIVLLALEEKGYGDDEIDLKIVDLAKGENFDPTFLRLNPKATVPTLVVPMKDTLSDDTESRFKAVADTKQIVELLDKSRSATSRTHTTSSAPAPALAPATIAFSAASTALIDGVLHAEKNSPSNLYYYNARDEASLQTLAKGLVPFLSSRKSVLEQLLADAESSKINVTEKVKNLWRGKLASTTALLDVLGKADTAESSLSAEDAAKRKEFFATAKKAWETDIKEALIKINKEIIGPFVFGDQISIADVHLAGWLARIARFAGCGGTDAGGVVVEKLEKHIGEGFSLPKDYQPQAPISSANRSQQTSKLAAFWDSAKDRASWKKVFSEGL